MTNINRNINNYDSPLSFCPSDCWKCIASSEGWHNKVNFWYLIFKSLGLGNNKYSDARIRNLGEHEIRVKLLFLNRVPWKSRREEDSGQDELEKSLWPCRQEWSWCPEPAIQMAAQASNLLSEPLAFPLQGLSLVTAAPLLHSRYYPQEWTMQKTWSLLQG